ncbi:von Willebrand factor A domain-containing protein 3B-like isoform X2 [Clavelina lepadiformis]|uniref:von Willebrand factor A domain-containing protein 3B-like isoform X2 n=1 Tax=Clavelina lepadiformis TaxID=159417 RepID=UPI0040411803
MAQVDLSNPDLLRNIDPIRKAVYDEEGSPKFHIGHLHEKPPVDLFGWADKERGKNVTYEMIGAEGNASGEQWELDVKPLISSIKWLQVHGLKRNRLTMQQILSSIGFKHAEEYVQTLGRPVGSFYGHSLYQQFKRKDGQLYNITVGREKLKKVEESLLRASHLFKRRLQWLTTGSRRVFGVIQEHCICIVIDVTTMSQTQFDLYRECLCDVIRNQVSQLAKFNMIKAQANMEMWHEQAMPVTELTIRNAIEWVNKLDRMAESSRTGCTEALLKAMEDDSLESVYLFAEGDSCEMSKELLRQKLAESPHPLHTISFNAAKSATITFLKELAAQTSGRFHAFVVKNVYEEDAEALPASAAPPGGDGSRISVRYAQKARGGLPPGAGVREDVFKVWMELEECRNTHAQIETLLTEIPDPKTEAASVDRPAITDGARPEQYMSSKEWLHRHGLEALKLTAFHALASCSFKHVDGVVDLKGKPGRNNDSSDAENVRKLVNAKYCEHFAHTQWKDGTLVHVHITAEQHKIYEKRMTTALNAIQQRIDWLQQGSREVFGTILEEQVYILIDTSQSMKDKLSMVKEKLFQLMQEQLRHKSKFNVVKFDTKAVAWKDRACDVTEQNLLNAWSWIKDIGVGGSTNTLAALRIALSDPHTHAIYLLTDGRPDQQPRSILAQVQLQHPVPIHTIAFNCNDLEANKFLHQLSSDTGGRYHNFTSNGSMPDAPPPFESEDVSLLRKELQNGKRDLEKVSKLRARCVMLDWYHNKKHKNTSLDTLSTSSGVSSRSSRSRTRSLTYAHRPKSAGVKRENTYDSDSSFKRPHSSLGYYKRPSPPTSPLLAVAHKSHRGTSGVNDSAILHRRSKSHNQGQHQAGHTKTSVLRLANQGETHGWLLPETQDFMSRQINKSMEAYQDIMRMKVEAKKKPKRKKKVVNPLDVPNSVWLKKNGLVPRKLSIMDILTPTAVKVTPKYIPVLDSHVVSKVFDEVLPIAHVSPRSRREVRLVNPAAVDLPGYDNRLRAAIDEYHQRLDLQVWRKLSQEERDKFDNGPVSYMNNTVAIHQALDNLGWPIEETDLLILADEIHLGEKYLQQSKDLQRTAKKVAMGRRKSSEDGSVCSKRNSSPKKVQSAKNRKPNRIRQSKPKKNRATDESTVTTRSTQSTYSSENSSESENEVKEKEDKPEKHKLIKRNNIDRLKGQKVIARDEIDGFYYTGVVVKSTDARHAQVLFKHGDEANIPTRFVIQRSGAVSCPPLKIGDNVLAFSRKDSNVSCYVPGIVIGTPRRSQVRDKFYTILKYSNTKTALLRNKMVKISPERYSLIVRYIEHASQIDFSVPPVDFVRPERREQPITKEDVEEIRGTLQGLQTTLDDSSREQQEQREILEQQCREIENVKKEIKDEHSGATETKQDLLLILNQHKFDLEDARKEIKDIALAEEKQQKDLEALRLSIPPEPVTPVTTTPMHSASTMTEVSPTTPVQSASTMTEVTPVPEPSSSTSSESRRSSSVSSSSDDPDPDTNRTIVSVDEKNDSVMITKEDKGVLVSRKLPEIISPGSALVRELSPKLDVGQEVLYRNTDDGWYYRGTVHATYPNDSYDILDCTDLIQNTFREDIITDEDDANNIITVNSTLIALHPNYPNSYAPAYTLECQPNNWFSVRFYDNSVTSIPREEVYLIHMEKFKKDIDYISEYENRWVGQAVVARSDMDGQYHLASCRRKIGTGHEYALQWADGSTSVQQLSCIFGKYTKQRPKNIGDFVLAIHDVENLIYLPGRVMAENGDKLVVNFCNKKRSHHVLPNQCYWISRQYYDLSVAFYNSKQVHQN